MKRERVHRMLQWTAAVLTLLMAAVLCLQCVLLYREGLAIRRATPTGSPVPPIFTRENVAQRLTALVPGGSLWGIVMVAAAMMSRGENRRAGTHRAPIPREVPTRRLLALRIGLGAMAAGLILWGVLNGGMYDVLAKASKICMECIGLG